jgi:hypothetical protein
MEAAPRLGGAEPHWQSGVAVPRSGRCRGAFIKALLVFLSPARLLLPRWASRRQLQLRVGVLPQNATDQHIDTTDSGRARGSLHLSGREAALLQESNTLRRCQRAEVKALRLDGGSVKEEQGGHVPGDIVHSHILAGHTHKHTPPAADTVITEISD